MSNPNRRARSASRCQDDYPSGYASEYDYPVTAAYVPATQTQPGQVRYPNAMPSEASDHRGRVTSVFSLLLAIVVMLLSFGGFLFPPLMIRNAGTSDVFSSLMYIIMGYGAIFAALLLQSPTTLMALRAVSNQKGHVGRGRGLVSIIVSCVFPITCLMLLTAFSIGQIQNAMASGVLPQVTTGSDGKPKLVMPESMGAEIDGIVGQVNDLAEEGYSVGVDGNGNLVATDPSGKQVTITSDDLAQIGL